MILPFLELTLPALSSSFTEAVGSFHTEFTHILSSLVDDVDSRRRQFAKALARAEEIVEEQNSVYLLHAQAKLWEWYTGCLSCFAAMFESSEAVYLIYCALLEIIRSADFYRFFSKFPFFLLRKDQISCCQGAIAGCSLLCQVSPPLI